MAVTKEVVELRNPSDRFGKYVKYLDTELMTLAKMRFEGYIKDEYNNPDLKLMMRDCLSLERFGLAHYATLYLGGRYSGWAWIITEAGVKELQGRRSRMYGCGCENAITLRCVCRGRTYCPNPDHEGNGCHGSHD